MTHLGKKARGLKVQQLLLMWEHAKRIKTGMLTILDEIYLRQDEFQQYYSKLEQVAPTNPFVLKTQAGKQCWRQTGIILISNLYLYIYRSLKSFGVYILHLSISMFQIFPVYLYIAQ